MEWKSFLSSMMLVLAITTMVLIIEISAYPAPEDYDQFHDQQGMREILEELERQGGLTAPMIPRSYFYHTNPNHAMTRKSQRSNSNLRLRFGKRSAGAGGPIFDDDEAQQQKQLMMMMMTDPRQQGSSNSGNFGNQITSLKNPVGQASKGAAAVSAGTELE